MAHCTNCKSKQNITGGKIVERGQLKTSKGFKGTCANCGGGLYKPLGKQETGLI
jgi:hypothetical protein